MFITLKFLNHKIFNFSLYHFESTRSLVYTTNNNKNIFHKKRPLYTNKLLQIIINNHKKHLFTPNTNCKLITNQASSVLHDNTKIPKTNTNIPKTIVKTQSNEWIQLNKKANWLPIRQTVYCMTAQKKITNIPKTVVIA